jgi:hypothetical protein
MAETVHRRRRSRRCSKSSAPFRRLRSSAPRQWSSDESVYRRADEDFEGFWGELADEFIA